MKSTPFGLSLSKPQHGPVTSRLARLRELLPVLIALAFYATAHGRWLLCAPLIAATVAIVLWDVRPSYRSWIFLASLLAGAAAGLALLLWSEPPQGPIPPAFLSPLTGAVAVAALYAGIAGQRSYAWTYAGLLAALCLHGAPGAVAYAGPIAFVASMLVCGLGAGGASRAGLAGLFAFTAFLALAAPGAVLVWNTMFRSEGLLMEAVARLTGQFEGLRGAGFDGALSLRRTSTIQPSDKSLLVVSGARVERLRTHVLESFDGETWLALEGAPAALGPSSRGRELQLLFLEDLGSLVPAPAGVVGASPAMRALPGAVLRTGEKLDGKGVRLRAEAEELQIEGPPDAGPLALPPSLRAELLPLAEQIAGSAATPRQKAEEVTAFFRDGFEYSLDVNLRGKGSPLAVLIRERRPAYCTYFASAAAVVLRALGVPARVVGGFALEPANRITGDTVVRQRDAHAWIEVYLPDAGRWVPFDPTPWRSRDQVTGIDRQPSWAGAVLEAFAWWLRGVGRDPVGALASIGRSFVFWAAVVALLAWRLLRARRRAARIHGGRAMRAADPVLASARGRYLALLKRQAGVRASVADTDEDLLAKIEHGAGAEARQAAQAFVSAYQRCRFGARMPEPSELESHLANLGDVLRWERAIGLRRTG